MVFDSLKKVFKFGGKSKNENIEKKRLSQINSEIDEYERDIQEYLNYSNSRNDDQIKTPPPSPYMPDKLSEGAAIADRDKETSSEEK